MATNTNIEWAHDTRNLFLGCTKVHSGCDNCYAERYANHWANDVWGDDKPRKIIKNGFPGILLSQATAKDSGTKRRVFINSLSDIFEKPMPLIGTKGEELWNGEGALSRRINTGDIRDRLFNEFIPACPDLIFLLLTKRPSNINKFMPESWHEKVPENVMFGTSPVDPKTFKTLVPQLKKVHGNPKLFLSIEPQLECIYPDAEDLSGIDWVIQGGESGPKKRPFKTLWARVMRDVCEDAQVPYFFKQIDKVQPIPPDLIVRQFPAYHGC